MRSAMSKHVYCPNCHRQFEAIPGSECFCGCGTAFRVKSDGRGVERAPDTQAEGKPPRQASLLEVN